MGVRTGIKALFLSIAILFGCASVQFPYDFYYTDLENQTLLGDSLANDLPLDYCKKDEEGNHPCVSMKKEKFQDLYRDYINTKKDLIRCQQDEPHPH